MQGQQPRRTTLAQQELHAMHASQQVKLELEQENARCDLLERQNAEMRKLLETEKQPAPNIKLESVPPGK